MHLAKVCATVLDFLGRYCPSQKPRSPKPLGNIKPSLRDSLERLTRAGKHLEELKAVMAAVQFDADLIPYQMEVEGKIGHRLTITMRDDAVTSVIIGDICHNLRASLDYLVFNLSALDSRLDYEWTQFPIEKRPKDFRYKADVRGQLGGMNASHRAAIESLQPYKGGKWARTLKNISNPDKHRHLVFTAWRVRPRYNTYRGSPPSRPRGTVVSAKFSDGSEVHADVYLSEKKTFGDGLPVIETLEEIKSQISQTLEAFKPDFE